MSRHAAGGKITAAHTTIIDDAVRVINRAQELPEVTKITLGIIKQIGPGKRRIQFTHTASGFIVKVRGGVTTQELYVYTSNPVSTREQLFRAFWISK